MVIRLDRVYRGDKYTIGHLYVDGEYFCDTMEPSINADSHPAIPLGSYYLSLVWSPKFRRYMIRLDVPRRSGILIHAGNIPEHTQGCILVGKNKFVGMLYNSRHYFELLRSKIIDEMKNGDSVIIFSVLDK